jgi:23S rRNA U2552 (ribose-2'-O)-methylase RlmE/FtsJ
MLSIEKSTYHPIVAKTATYIKNIFKSHSVGDILRCNPLEGIVPVNIWFHDDRYQVIDIHENNQHIRMRLFKGISVTPIVIRGLPHPLICHMSLYQPFFPEVFFQTWEILARGYVYGEKILHIGFPSMLESIIMYNETQQLDCVYHHVNSNGFNKLDDDHCFSPPDIDYLNQVFYVTNIEHEKQLITYDFVMIDLITSPVTQSCTLNMHFFYTVMSLKNLCTGGAMLIKINMISHKKWYTLYSLLSSLFEERDIIRCSISNPYNPELFIYFNNFSGKIPSRLVRVSTIYLDGVDDIHTFATNKHTVLFDEVETWCKSLCNSDVDIFESHKVTEEWLNNYGFVQIAYLDEVTIPSVDIITIPLQDNNLTTISHNRNIDTKLFNNLVTNKIKLNSCKRTLDTRPSHIFSNRYRDDNTLYTWEQLTSDTNIFKTLKRDIVQSCRGHMVTNAWLKLREILIQCPKIITIHKSRTFKTFHLCEAPGAFVSSLHHYLNDINVTQWSWHAQTLGAENCNALEDHMGLISKYPSKWFMGDITDPEVIRSYINNESVNDVDFMTADGGIHCDPKALNMQEAVLSKLMLGQFTCIVGCLSDGGSAVMKMFLPMVEILNISIVYTMTTCFQSVEIVKPVTSNPYNSEIYLVMQGYRKLSTDNLNKLLLILNEPTLSSSSAITRDIFSKRARTFRKEYSNMASSMMSRQILSIYGAYRYYFGMDTIEPAQYIYYSNQWIDKNNVGLLKDVL